MQTAAPSNSDVITNRFALNFDGWYMYRTDAVACLDQCRRMGAKPVGIVESKYGTFGILYLCPRTLFPNHRLDGHNAIFAALRA